ncbi:unnamed protein product, partial [Prorocentrum cordatum]
MTSNTTLTLAYWRKRMLAHGRPHADTTALRAETAEKQGLGPDTTSDKNSLRGRKAARAQEAKAQTSGCSNFLRVGPNKVPTTSP